ncbi:MULTISPECIES: papain-like cysteine protease family protein [unclassified Nocardiopsis]|uniref:papain-like cysteine protease family protein n=1 Tax=unclassified Nocardiopsis TaxID=2649073 RepID=UPI0033F3B5DC
MLKRFLSVVAMATLLLGIAATPAVGAARTLGVVRVSQEKSQWCWAAGAQMMVRYHTSNKPSQCTLVKRGKKSSTCANATGTLDELRRAMGQSGMGNTGSKSGSAASFANVRTDIDKSRPLLIRIAWKSTQKKTAHIGVVRGYDTSGSKVKWVYVRNAPATSEYRSTSHSTLKNNKDWAWTHTIRNARK